MMEQVNLSRLSHGVRAAAMMRRCVNEALAVRAHAARRSARPSSTIPLMRRQLMKMRVPAEQALSMFLFAASAMDRANAGDDGGAKRAAHPDAAAEIPRLPRQHPVATGAMEVRGGNGYIEEWVHRAAGARRPHRRALGRHQQHQRARHHHPRGRQEPRAPAACAALGKLLDEADRHSRRLPRPPAADARPHARIRRTRRGRARAGR